MSKTWYPVIDYELCIECGSCTNKCQKGVYNLKKAPTPVVIKPDNCVHGCRGCGNLCNSNAISYVGDNNHNENFCSCDGGC